jgi:hypothetical protein
VVRHRDEAHIAQIWIRHSYPPVES